MVGLFYRYIYVKVSTQVTPNRLLDSGRIKAKSVFIITNVDNRHHINIVLDFNKYLKVRSSYAYSINRSLTVG